jgi:hypothetical protein
MKHRNDLVEKDGHKHEIHAQTEEEKKCSDLEMIDYQVTWGIGYLQRAKEEGHTLGSNQHGDAAFADIG